jgi:hypothetical protein
VVVVEAEQLIPAAFDSVAFASDQAINANVHSWYLLEFKSV